MNRISEILSSLTCGKYIPKHQKTELTKITEELVDTKYEKLVIQIKEIIETNKLRKKMLETLTELVNELKEQGITTNEAYNLIEEAIREIEEENLEKELDRECERYNKFTESNPAEHIRYDKTNEKYLLNYDDIKKSKRKVDELVIKLKEKIKDKNMEKFHKFVLIKKITYKSKKIIIYISEDKKAYFDINHTINLFDTTSKKDKYQEYKSDIVAYDFRDNEFGGFYIKEFVNKETFFRMILHTNSIFSNKFKDDIAKILDKLTDSGQLIISNDQLVINTEPKKKPIEYFNEYEYTQTYENQLLVNFVKNLIKNFKQVNINKYLKKHVMYMFIITLDDPDGLNRILTKIGYTCDLADRIKGLQNEYKCKFYLIGLKTVYSVQDEKELHRSLKALFPEFIVNLKIGSNDKDETYVFDTNLYKMFANYADKVKFTDEEIKLEKETESIINDYFSNIEERFELELVLKLRQIIKIDKINNQIQKETAIEMNREHYKLLILRENANLEIEKIKINNQKELDIIKENHRHIEAMKDVELKKIELEMLKIQSKFK